MAFAVGRRVGTAVVRNRVRRRLRAQLLELARSGQLAGGDLLVIARPRAAELASPELRQHLERALRQMYHEETRDVG